MSKEFELESFVSHVHRYRFGCRRPNPPWASAALLLHARLAQARLKLGNRQEEECEERANGQFLGLGGRIRSGIS